MKDKKLTVLSLEKVQAKLKDLVLLREIGRVGDARGVDVYAVGGYVRDLFLDRPGPDIDLVVVGDGIPFARQVSKKLGSGKVAVYRTFGTAKVEIDGYRIEFVGARKESYREDSRKPAVESATLEEDLTRRDFTINAMALQLNEARFGELVDYFDGCDALGRGLLKTPLPPEATFSDDPLRILRAIRFATQLGFEIDPAVKAAIPGVAHRLSIISQERITDEFMKVLGAPRPSDGFLLMDETGVLKYVFPELLPMKGVEQRQGFHHKDVFYHTLQVVDNVARVSDNLDLRFAALAHDVAKPRTKAFVEGKGWTFHGHDEIGARMLGSICHRMRINNDTMKYAQKLVRLHLRPINLSNEGVTDSAIRRLIVQAGEQLEDLMTLCRADITSGNPRRVKRHLQNFDYVSERVMEVDEKDRLRAFQSPVRGDEIMEICGLGPGPLVGRLKKMIEEAILDGELENTHEAALQFLLKKKDEVLAQAGGG